MTPQATSSHHLCEVSWEHKVVLGQPQVGVRAAFCMTVTEVRGQDGDLRSLKDLLTWALLENVCQVGHSQCLGMLNTADPL